MRKLTSLCQTCVTITSTLEENKVLPLVVDRAKNLIQAEKVVACLINKKSGKFKLDSDTLAIRGRQDQHPESWWRRELENIAQNAAKQGKIRLTPDETSKWIETLTSQSEETILFCVPFSTTGRDMGVLSALNSPPYRFTPHEASILSILASQAAVAIENARLFKKLQTQGGELMLLQKLEKLTHKVLESQEEERKRISRQLHDDTSQAFTNMIIRLQLSESMIPPEFVKVKQILKELKEITEAALQGVHRIAFNLRPPMLDQLGLIPTIKWIIHNHIETSGLKINFKTIGARKKLFPKRIETAILRIVQESLSNVTRHAQASRAWVVLDFEKERVNIFVKDDGRGFDPEEIFQKSEALGLIGMKERAELLGGKLEIKSHPGEGAQIISHIPTIS